MSLSIYQVSVPIFQRHLACLSAMLDKAAQYTLARKIEPSVLLQTRLYPDMFALVKQIQLSTDFANRAVARLAGVEVPPASDTETNFDELKTRIARTIDFVSSLRPEQFEGSENKDLLIPMGPRGNVPYKGGDYLLTFALPNFFFHVTTSYDILRHCGVELTKMDFMAPPSS
jgi:hypothetical protein